MAIIQDLIHTDKYPINSPNEINPIGIMVFNAQTDAPARSEVSYMASTKTKNSFHIAIDNKESIQAIPFNRATWLDNNSKFITIVICYGRGGGIRFDDAERRAAKEIACLLKQMKWNVSKVKNAKEMDRHIPNMTYDKGWERFLQLIKMEMGAEETKEEMVPEYTIVAHITKDKKEAEEIEYKLKRMGLSAFVIAK